MIKPKRIRFPPGDKVVCLPVERGELPTVCLVVEQSHGLVDVLAAPALGCDGRRKTSCRSVNTNRRSVTGGA
jgi:hypothetical protein